MDKADIVPILLVGFGENPVARELESRLRDAGYPVMPLRDVRRISAILSDLGRATIVVYDQEESAAAEQALSFVHEGRRGGAVVVVVEHADFAQYYALMNQGAIGYFEAEEPSSVIFAGVTRAARQAFSA
jgi:DNA-binding NtrC family response regulator